MRLGILIRAIFPFFVVLVSAPALMAQPKEVRRTVTITDQRHHIGDGIYPKDSKCFRLENEGTSYTAEFVIPDDPVVLDPYITIDEVCGHRGQVPWLDFYVGILINERLAARFFPSPSATPPPTIYTSPFDLNLQGRKNSIRIDLAGAGDIADLEFQGVRLHYRTFIDPQVPSSTTEGRVAQLRFVRQNAMGFEPITELTYDQPFYVEAHFDVAPTEKRKAVKLEWAAGQGRAVVVAKTEKDPKVFRSDKIIARRPPTNTIETTPNVRPAPIETTPNVRPAPIENTSVLYHVVGVTANDQLKMRSGPGATNVEVGIIPHDATGVRSLGEERQVGNSTWVKISYKGVEGWVNKRFLASR